VQVKLAVLTTQCLVFNTMENAGRERDHVTLMKDLATRSFAMGRTTPDAITMTTKVNVLGDGSLTTFIYC
jgi:hypothetical protein